MGLFVGEDGVFGEANGLWVVADVVAEGGRGEGDFEFFGGVSIVELFHAIEVVVPGEAWTDRFLPPAIQGVCRNLVFREGLVVTGEGGIGAGIEVGKFLPRRTHGELELGGVDTLVGGRARSVCPCLRAIADLRHLARPGWRRGDGHDFVGVLGEVLRVDDFRGADRRLPDGWSGELGRGAGGGGEAQTLNVAGRTGWTGRDGWAGGAGGVCHS
jgi:hypothetical protein